MLGFYGTAFTRGSEIYENICHRGLGGVILFDRHPTKKGVAKNIVSPAQLKHLTAALRSCGTKPLIAIDEEGGRVQRLRAAQGFYGKYPSARDIAKLGPSKAKAVYQAMAKELLKEGINYNLAPVADLAINPKNVVINKLGRSYGANPETVAEYDKIFINAMRREGIATALKHFPGHGSSLGDTHKGFVDVTKLWKSEELEPYRILIKEGKADTIMAAHIFNAKLDPHYPASLSRKIISGILRKKLGFKGVIISDDMQMGAIAKHYSLKERIALAVNAGVDILLFANQSAEKNRVTLPELIKITRRLIKEKRISILQIREANRRIKLLKSRIH